MKPYALISLLSERASEQVSESAQSECVFQKVNSRLRTEIAKEKSKGTYVLYVFVVGFFFRNVDYSKSTT